MSESALSIRHLSKKYTIGGNGHRYLTLRDAIAGSVKNPFQKILHHHSPPEIWALKDVSFEVDNGKIVGIIGRNGAGKTTLLKILSRITPPTEGCAEIRGRVGSLLEVGTGFHSELTGRENIYLNGSILGMKRQEINDRFDDIVKFAEIERFLDTPVKHFSSGMYMRLAFAVAAFLDTDILIVDEVLAVGDAVFQKKCLGTMEHVTHEGRTVLFVSHNMNAIQQLCSSCILLENGRLVRDDQNVQEVINYYLFGESENGQNSVWSVSGSQIRDPNFSPLRLFLSDESSNMQTNPIPNDRDIWIQIEGEISTLDPALAIGYVITGKDGTVVYWSLLNDSPEDQWPRLEKGFNIIRTKIPRRFLNEGIYRFELIASLRNRQWILEPGKNAPAIFLSVQGGLSDSPFWTERRQGVIAPVMEWYTVR
jgi:lipopolysaccharide transport system ATP-binding protein